jgi:hypothetical protein
VSVLDKNELKDVKTATCSRDTVQNITFFCQSFRAVGDPDDNATPTPPVVPPCHVSTIRRMTFSNQGDVHVI